jgi:tetratricopeptide (TPR) repeat protein
MITVGCVAPPKTLNKLNQPVAPRTKFLPSPNLITQRKYMINYLLHLLRTILIIAATILFIVNPVYALELNPTDNIDITPGVEDIRLIPQYCKVLSGEEGIKVCNLAIMLNPDDIISWNNRGEKLFKLGRYSEALNTYNHALLIDSEYSLVLANRCGALSALQRYSEALKSCQYALKGNKKWGISGEVLAWNNQGDALFKLGRYQESLTSFDKAIAINPNFENLQTNREIVLNRLNM